MNLINNEGFVRVGVAAAVPATLNSLGVDAASVISEAGIDPELLKNPDSIIPYTARGHLLQLCADRTGCEHFGLLLGKHGRLSSFGLIGHLARQSANVGEALACLVRFFHLHVQSARLTLSTDDDQSRLSYVIQEPNIEALTQIEDGAMSWAFNIMKELYGPGFQATEVRFRHKAPRKLKPYRSQFGSPVSFNAHDDGLYFPAEYLDEPIQNADRDLFRILRQQVEAEDRQFSESFLDHFRWVVHSVLWVRQAKAEDVAALFSVSSRTLERRLSELGTSYRNVVEEVKNQIACQLLSSTDLNLEEIAEFLHYADASAFIKAFKRWNGMTPSKWRRALRNRSRAGN